MDELNIPEKAQVIAILFFIFIAVFGQIAHIFKKLADLEKREDFILKEWVKSNCFSLIYGLTVIIPSIIVLFQMNQLNMSTAVLVGYTGDSLMKSAKNKFEKKKP